MTMQKKHLITATHRIVRRLSRGGQVAAAIVVLLGSISVAGARNHINTSTGMTLAEAPLAIHGFDPVAYFTEGQARVGEASFTATHGDAAYRFVSQANKEKFEKNPERYVPQYGGYCAFGVSVGAKFDGDPRLFKVVDGKLYFNLNREIQKNWLKDVPGNIHKADANWRKIHDKSPMELK